MQNVKKKLCFLYSATVYKHAPQDIRHYASNYVIHMKKIPQSFH